MDKLWQSCGNSSGTRLTQKISSQTSLTRNPSNSHYIFLLNMNFENLTVALHDLSKSYMLVKFQEDQRSITTLSMTCLNFKILR